MRKIELSDIIALIPDLELSELEALEMSIQVAINIRAQGQLSSERGGLSRRGEEGPGLNDQGVAILEDQENYKLSLADQALLGALILSEGYQQGVFSSRDINDVIEETGRPRIAHVTSAISGLQEKHYLTGSSKELSLSSEGRAKARGLIGMMRRRVA